MYLKIKVQCNTANGSEKWHSTLTSIRHDPTIFKRSGWKHTPANSAKVNVLVFLLDSISRLSVIRKLPNTYKYLKNNLHADIFEG